MKYYTKTIDEKEYNFRLTNEDICNIENKMNKSIQEVIGSPSFNKLTLLIKYMRKGDTSDFKNAGAFVDYLIDEGFSLETIYTDIVYPTCKESGIITENDLNNIMEAITNQHKKKAEDLVKQ